MGILDHIRWWFKRGRYLYFAKKAGSGRVTDDSISNLRNADAILIVAVWRFGVQLVGVSMCMLDADEYRATNSVTVVKKPFRKKGLGTSLMSRKLGVIKELDFDYNVYVAEDNLSSRKMLEKSGVTEVISRSLKTRKKGRYVRLRYKANVRNNSEGTKQASTERGNQKTGRLERPKRKDGVRRLHRMAHSNGNTRQCVSVVEL